MLSCVVLISEKRRGGKAIFMNKWEQAGDGNEATDEMKALRMFVMRDHVKIAILEHLTKKDWCTLSDLCRVARGYDRYAGPVRVSTILQYMEGIAKEVLEKSENGFSVKWRIKPEKRKTIEKWIEELKTTHYRKVF